MTCTECFTIFVSEAGPCPICYPNSGARHQPHSLFPAAPAGREASSSIVSTQATPHDAAYHTFEFKAATAQLAKHPPDWYDGKPKRCPGSGMPPAVQFHGDVGLDREPKYRCRCPWCDGRFRPGPMVEHSFVPVRVEDITFATGKYVYGIEPVMCDGEHPIPRCDSPQCYHRDPRAGEVKAPRTSGR